jgi:hypothetical protein
MLPHTHATYGAIFALIIYLLFPITLSQAALIFLASFLIDFDHYTWYVLKKKDFSLKNAYYFLKELEHKKRSLMLFHTIEFHLLVFLLAYIWIGFWFILLGMIFHSILDIIHLVYEKKLSQREFCLLRYIISDKSKYF